MFVEERREDILKQLHTNGRVLAKELSEHYGVSIDSIRRDLAQMAETGLLKKTHGGAIPLEKVRYVSPPPEIRYNQGTIYENAIALAAVKYIESGDTIFIGSGNQHFVFANHIPAGLSITVVTNALKIVELFRERSEVDVYVAGGKVKPSGNISDALAYQFIKQFSIDTAFLCGGGVSVNGISTATPEVAAFTRMAASVSRRKIILAPGTVLGTNAFALCIPITDAELLITDEEADDEIVNAIEAKGVTVERAAL